MSPLLLRLRRLLLRYSRLHYDVFTTFIARSKKFYKPLLDWLSPAASYLCPLEISHLVKCHERRDIPTAARRLEYLIFRRWGSGWKCPDLYHQEEAQTTKECELFALNASGQLFSFASLAQKHGHVQRFTELLNHFSVIFTEGTFDSAAARLTVKAAPSYGCVVYWVVGCAVRDHFDPFDLTAVSATARTLRQTFVDTAVENQAAIEPERLYESDVHLICGLLRVSIEVDLGVEGIPAFQKLLLTFTTTDRAKNLRASVASPSSPHHRPRHRRRDWRDDFSLQPGPAGAIRSHARTPSRHPGRSTTHRVLPPAGVKLSDKDLWQLLWLIWETEPSLPHTTAQKNWPADFGANGLPISQRILAGPAAIKKNEKGELKYVDFRNCFALMGGGDAAKIMSDSSHLKEFW